MFVHVIGIVVLSKGVKCVTKTQSLFALKTCSMVTVHDFIFQLSIMISFTHFEDFPTMLSFGSILSWSGRSCASAVHNAQIHDRSFAIAALAISQIFPPEISEEGGLRNWKGYSEELTHHSHIKSAPPPPTPTPTPTPSPHPHTCTTTEEGQPMVNVHSVKKKTANLRSYVWQHKARYLDNVRDQAQQVAVLSGISIEALHGNLQGPNTAWHHYCSLTRPHCGRNTNHPYKRKGGSSRLISG